MWQTAPTVGCIRYPLIAQNDVANRDCECCKSHGAVRALDAATGGILWTAHMTGDDTSRSEDPAPAG